MREAMMMEGILYRRVCRGLLIGILLLGAPAASWAYVECIDVVNVYPDGTTTHCKDCNIYSNRDGSWQGEVTSCDGSGTRGGAV
jgi:hypothetical protein